VSPPSQPPPRSRPSRARNLVNLEQVTQTYGGEPVLDRVSLGVAAGERIGVVGRNGGGKSTLLRALSGVETPTSGRVTRSSDVSLGLLGQRFALLEASTVGECVLGRRPEHEWASSPRAREALTALLGGFDDVTLGRRLGELSGGERRRVELAALLLHELDIVVLDEPTNHLDVEAVGWLAEHLRNRRLAVVVVTHDRWFLDAVTERTWEVGRGAVEEYDGGYSAYVLAKAERQRQQSAEWARHANLLRKELAWLRRGPPARTAKPRFRIDAANALIDTEPPPRDDVELVRFAGARLGKTVFEVHDAGVRFGDRTVLDHVTWDVGPGDRMAVLGPNGAGKSTLLRLLLGRQPPSDGRVVTGVTVRSALLSQHLDELDPSWRVLEAVEEVGSHVDLGRGRELSASQLCERLGFGADAQWTPVGELSGGERRRLQLTRLLMTGPNVLLLDEPTNDFDVETLTAVEDLLDGFAGSLLVVSHDRYFLERVCTRFVGLFGDGRVRDLPGGVEEYLRLRSAQPAGDGPADAPGPPRDKDLPGEGQPHGRSSTEQRRQARKDMARLERALAGSSEEEQRLHAAFAASATDHEAVTALNRELEALLERRRRDEDAWLAAAERAD